MSTFPRLINLDADDDEVTRQRAMNSALNGGPNSGFALFNMDLFGEDAETNQFPELQEDIDLVVSTESYVRQLVELHRQVTSGGGMNKGLAMELHRLVPDMQSYGLNHFTEENSLVNYEATLESISGKLVAIIAAGIAILVGLIWKFVSWLMRRNKSRGGQVSDKVDFTKSRKEIEAALDISKKASDASAKVADKVEDLVEDIRSSQIEFPVIPGLAKAEKNPMPEDFNVKAIDDLVKVAAKTNVSRDGGEPLTVGVTIYELLNSYVQGNTDAKDVPKFINPEFFEAYKDFFHRPNPLLVDAMTKGDMAKTMETAGNIGEVLARLMDHNYKLLDSLERTDRFDQFHDVKGHAKRAADIEALVRFDSITWKGRKGVSLADIVQDMKDSIDNVDMVYDEKFDLIDLVKISKKYAQLSRRADFFSKSKRFAEVMERTAFCLEQLKSLTESPRDRHDDVGSRAIYARMHQITINMLKDYKAAIEYFVVLDDYERRIMRFISDTAILLREGMNHLARYYVVRNLEIPSELKKIMDKFEIDYSKTGTDILSSVLHKVGDLKE